MISKKKLQQIGFDSLEDPKTHHNFLKNIQASGISQFNQAYASGLSMILELNKNFKEIQEKDPSFQKTPLFLHFVVSSEGDAANQNPNDKEKIDENEISLSDLKMLQRVLKKQAEQTLPFNNYVMQENEIRMTENYEKNESKSLVEMNDLFNEEEQQLNLEKQNINHQTIFIQYLNDENDSTGLKKDSLQLAMHLGNFAKVKTINNTLKKSKNYLQKQIDIFKQRKVFSKKPKANNDLNFSQEKFNFEQQDLSQVESIKIIVFTVACSQKMDEIQSWDSLSLAIQTELDKLFQEQRKNHENDFIICLNIHNGNQKVPYTKFENVKSDDWKNWKNQINENDLMNDAEFLNTHSEANNLDFLNQINQKKGRLQKLLSSQIFLNYIRVSIRLFSLLICSLGFWFVVKTEYQDSNCWANKGTLVPFKFNHLHDDRIYVGKGEDDWFPFISSNKIFYSDVSSNFKILFILFILFNLIDICVCIGMSLFKFKRSFLKLINESQQIAAPFIFLVLLISIISMRFQMESKICLCDFKQDYLGLRNVSFSISNSKISNIYEQVQLGINKVSQNQNYNSVQMSDVERLSPYLYQNMKQQGISQDSIQKLQNIELSLDSPKQNMEQIQQILRNEFNHEYTKQDDRYLCKPLLAKTILLLIIFECIFSGTWFLALIYFYIMKNYKEQFKQFTDYLTEKNDFQNIHKVQTDF